MDLIIIFEGFVIFSSLRIFFNINLISWLLSDELSRWVVSNLLNMGIHTVWIIFLATILILALLSYFLRVRYLSELFSSLGIYHPLKNSDSPFGETFQTKIKNVFILNLQVSSLIFIDIFFFVVTITKINESIKPDDFVNILVTFLVICPSILLSLRLLVNPVKNYPTFLHILIKSFTKPYDNLEAIKKEKERLLSLFSSMILTVLFTLIIVYVYLLLSNLDVLISSVNNLLDSAISELSILILKILISLFSFIICLSITTFIGEWFLKKYQVIDIDYSLIKNPKIKK